MRILVIEDDTRIASLLKRSLENECYAVDIAIDGEQGVYLAKINTYDLITLDLVLPKRDGLEVCRTLRADGFEIPILVISVKGDSAVKIQTLDAGADDYIDKPFSIEEVLARTRALLRRPKAIEEEILTIDTLTLDSRRHIVKQENRDIYLTRKEFMLLEYLLRNKGRVLSRSMIMEHVWDMNADPFSNTIESHILSLRKKISADDTRRLIHTVPGRGYKIDLPDDEY